MASPPNNDRAWRGIAARVTGMGDLVLKVGVIGVKAARPVEGEDGGNITIGELAGVHEFGAAIQMPWGVLLIPERSFIRATLHDNRNEYRALIARLAAQVLAGRLTEAMALGRLGLQIVGDMQKRIAEGIAPVNAPSTIEAKGSDTPLIDTGRLRQSISFAIVPASEV